MSTRNSCCLLRWVQTGCCSNVHQHLALRNGIDTGHQIQMKLLKIDTAKEKKISVNINLKFDSLNTVKPCYNAPPYFFTWSIRILYSKNSFLLCFSYKSSSLNIFITTKYYRTNDGIDCFISFSPYLLACILVSHID